MYILILIIGSFCFQEAHGKDNKIKTIRTKNGVIEQIIVVIMHNDLIDNIHFKTGQTVQIE